MLTEFKVRNFKNFRDELIFSLESQKSYEFNKDLIPNGIVRDSVVVGYNGVGKTNLGRAIFDIVLNLTDRSANEDEFSYFVNLHSNDDKAYFSYRFQFEQNQVEYKYEKNEKAIVTREILSINGKRIIIRDEGRCVISLSGAESLNVEYWDNDMPLVKYVARNTMLNEDDEYCKAFKQFISFVERMLMFSSAGTFAYRGFKNVKGNVYKLICEMDHGVENLEEFLHDMGIHYKLFAKDDGDGLNIYCRMGEKCALLSKILSSGTRALVFFFYWYIQSNDISFVYIDEFDAFYHTDLAIAVVKRLLKLKDLQVVLTTHNTDIITNELLRPDCYYLLEDNSIVSFNNKTTKALRAAHNLQKMYKAGAFNE